MEEKTLKEILKRHDAEISELQVKVASIEGLNPKRIRISYKY